MSISDLDELSPSEMVEYREVAENRLADIGRRADRGAANQAELAERRELREEVDEIDRRWRAREAEIREAAGNPKKVETEVPHIPGGWRDDSSMPAGYASARSAALRVIDQNDRILSREAGDNLVALVERDKSGFEARYLTAVGDPHYSTAFG